MSERQQHDVPGMPGWMTTAPMATTELISAPESSTLWRATRLILAWVAIVALVEVILSLAWALAFGIDVSSRLAELNQPAPAFSECVGEVCD
jgi:hypothetical protein